MIDMPFHKRITQDSVWGWIIIGLGIVLLIFKPIDKFDRYLSGQTETVVTVLLIIVVLIYIAILIRGNAVVKTAALLWAVTP